MRDEMIAIIMENQNISPEAKYVVSTNKGYLIGNVYEGISFTDNWAIATRFSEDDLLYNRRAIEENLREFYDTEFIGFVPV